MNAMIKQYAYQRAEQKNSSSIVSSVNNSKVSSKLMLEEFTGKNAQKLCL